MKKKKLLSYILTTSLLISLTANPKARTMITVLSKVLTPQKKKSPQPMELLSGLRMASEVLFLFLSLRQERLCGIHQIAFWQLLQKLQSPIFQNTLTNVKIRDLALIVWRATQVIWPKTGMVTKLRLYLKTTIL